MSLCANLTTSSRAHDNAKPGDSVRWRLARAESTLAEWMTEGLVLSLLGVLQDFVAAWIEPGELFITSVRSNRSIPFVATRWIHPA